MSGFQLENAFNWEHVGPNNRVASTSERVTHKLVNAKSFYHGTRTATTGVKPRDDAYKRFPIMTLKELCPEADSLPARQIAGYRSRYLAKVGTWTSRDGVWSMTLALTTPMQRNPFYKETHTELLLFTTCKLDQPLPEGNVRIKADIKVSLEEPFFVRTVKGQEPEVTPLGQMWLASFDESSTVAVCRLEYEQWIKALEGPAYNKYPHMLIHFDIRGEFEISPRIDLSGIGRMLQDQSDILHKIIDIGPLSLQDVANLRATTKAVRSMLELLPERRLRIALQRYFPNADDAFAAALRNFRALISGSTMLSILKPGDWEPSDLDIIVDEWCCDRLIDFLHQQGYEEDEERRRGVRELYPEAAINHSGFVKWRYLCFVRLECKIDLCVVSAGLTPASFILADYHSTAVMNFYDGHAIYCMFPTWTFDGVFMRNKTKTTRSRTEVALDKLKMRGFRERPGLRGASVQDWLPHATNRFGKLEAEKLPQIWCQQVSL